MEGAQGWKLKTEPGRSHSPWARQHLKSCAVLLFSSSDPGMLRQMWMAGLYSILPHHLRLSHLHLPAGIPGRGFCWLFTSQKGWGADRAFPQDRLKRAGAFMLPVRGCSCLPPQSSRAPQRIMLQVPTAGTCPEMHSMAACLALPCLGAHSLLMSPGITPKQTAFTGICVLGSLLEKHFPAFQSPAVPSTEACPKTSFSELLLLSNPHCHGT